MHTVYALAHLVCTCMRMHAATAPLRLSRLRALLVDGLHLLPVVAQVAVDVGGDSLEGGADVPRPEGVRLVQVVGGGARLAAAAAAAAVGLLVDADAIELHAQQVMAEAAVAPGVLHHDPQVGRALHEHEQRPLEARAALRVREEARVRLVSRHAVAGG